MLEENLLKIYETSFRENREMPALTDYFKAKHSRITRWPRRSPSCTSCSKRPASRRRQDSADRPQQPRWCITYIATISYGAVIVPILAGFRPCRHHPHHQPLGKQAALSGRQLLGHHRRRPDTPDRGRVFAHRLPRHLRTQRQGAHQVPARYPEKLPFDNIRAGSASTTSSIPRSPTTRSSCSTTRRAPRAIRRE